MAAQFPSLSQGISFFEVVSVFSAIDSPSLFAAQAPENLNDCVNAWRRSDAYILIAPSEREVRGLMGVSSKKLARIYLS